MLMDLLHGFEVLSTTEETLFKLYIGVQKQFMNVLEMRITCQITYLVRANNGRFCVYGSPENCGIT